MKTMTHLSASIRAFLLTIILTSAAWCQAQDTLFLWNRNHIVCTVIEIGREEIKYSEYDSQLKLVMVLDKSEVERLKFANGREIRFPRDPHSVALPVNLMSKTHVVKLDMLAPVVKHVVIGYEHIIAPWTSVEAKIGVIGIGMGQWDSEYRGVMAKAGIKFISRPDYVSPGQRINHPLHGRYVKPEIIFNSYGRTFERYTSQYDFTTGLYSSGSSMETVRVGNLAFNVAFGKQRFLGQGITLDTFVGVGFGTQWNDMDDSNANETAGWESYVFSHMLVSRDLPLVLSAGMTLGVAF